MKKNAIIKAVAKGGIADRIGLFPGDEIISVNGQGFHDFLEYKFLMTDERVELKVKDRNGRIKRFTIFKSFDEGLGVDFENPLMDEIKRCKNKCIFCFVDQMPSGLRNSLYVKDDDYRLSAAFGTFVTLTNLSRPELERIVKLGLSPIYVSVHATDGKVRNFMMKNPHSGNILNILKFLTSHKIYIHCQIVLCPGINDGMVLKQTLEDLFDMWPYVLSIAVVPVGITKFRDNLYPLRVFTKSEAEEVIDFIEDLQNRNLKKFGSRLAFAADEFYCIAKKRVPDYENYEDFYQLENGVGMIALLKNQVEQHIKKLPRNLGQKRKVIVVTGVSAHEYLRQILHPLKKIHGLELEIYPVINNFFGPSVTVAGLITGKDLMEQLRKKEPADALLIPDVMLNEGEFLDDLKVEDVENYVGKKIEVVSVDGRSLLNAIIGNNWRI